MPNRIRQLAVVQHRLNPAEAELWISVYPEQLTASTEVRGRLMGPRCRYSTTVEVAYPLREWKRFYEKEDVPHFLMRVIIPEPNFWDPQSPFLYEGPVELWQGKERCDQAVVSRGLRSANLSPRGLRWNGRLLTIRGVRREKSAEDEALHLHRQGCNAFLFSLDSHSDALWQIADRFGFLMLGRIDSRKQLAQADARAGHPSRLGWVLSQEMLNDPLLEGGFSLLADDATDGGCLIGVELVDKPDKALPEKIQFVLCRKDLLSDLHHVPLPKLILGQGALLEESHADEVELPMDTLGVIQFQGEKAK